MIMLFQLVLVVWILHVNLLGVDSQGFIYNGFQSAKNLSLDGIAEFTNNGLLMLTNSSYDTSVQTGHAFYPRPIEFGNSSSFSTTFVFAIRSELRTKSAQGLTFFIAPNKNLPGGRSFRFFGLFNDSNDGNSSNRIFAVEFDTFLNPNTTDINDNHVGIDVNGISSLKQAPAGYYSDDDNGKDFENLTLMSGDPIQAWVDYDGFKKQISVTLAPISISKPSTPLINLTYDLSPILNQSMYVGLSSSTSVFVVNHYILGWSFQANNNGGLIPGKQLELDISGLPELPNLESPKKKVPVFLLTGVPLICIFSLLLSVFSVIYYIRRKRKFAEVLEDWEVAYGPHHFKYRDLYIATKGFKNSELLGAGGFGRVYKGVLPSTKLEIAVKRVSHETRQGMRQFVAEIVSIGRMRHRNLVPLLGYCRRRGELLLVYEYMPNGSLDKLIYGPRKLLLDWEQRFRIIKGVASALFYLHEEWEQVVVHRDVKASNVLLDDEMNGRLGDFGLARLYDHGSDPLTTHVVGTVGYLAPEQYITGKATTSTDVYAFGAFLLEVVCGRRPIEPKRDVILVDRVIELWSQDRILEAVEPNLGMDFDNDEAELVLKLGLLCTNSKPTGRPSMHLVLLYLYGSMALPELSSVGISASSAASSRGRSFEDGLISAYTELYQSGSYNQYSHGSGSILSGGR